MNEVLRKFETIGIIPVVVLDDARDAEALGNALVAGGLPAAEVTFRTAAAEESIRIMASKCPGLLVGAGTVLTVDQAERAINAGAKFIVSPGLNPKVVEYCKEHHVVITPGVQTPTEIEMAMEMGLEVVKFFPAEPAGGLKMIKALAAPYTSLRFMPTGGINPDNVRDYLAYDRLIACGGSWMVKKDLIAKGAFDEIRRKVEEASLIVHEIRGLNKAS